MKLFDFGAFIIVALILAFAGTQAAQTMDGKKVVSKIEAQVKPHLDKVKITAPYINPNM